MEKRAPGIGPHAGNNGEQPIRVLFLCTANSARSQLAEALLIEKGGSRFTVESAGTYPAQEVRPEVVRMLAQMGIDWSARKPKSLDAVLDREWDLVITLCDRIKEACVALRNRPIYLHWGIPHPAGVTDPRRREGAFKEALALIAWRLDLMLALRGDLLVKLVDEERQRVTRAFFTDAGPDAVRPEL